MIINMDIIIIRLNIILVILIIVSTMTSIMIITRLIVMIVTMLIVIPYNVVHPIIGVTPLQLWVASNCQKDFPLYQCSSGCPYDGSQPLERLVRLQLPHNLPYHVLHRFRCFGLTLRPWPSPLVIFVLAEFCCVEGGVGRGKWQTVTCMKGEMKGGASPRIFFVQVKVCHLPLPPHPGAHQFRQTPRRHSYTEPP